MDLDFDNVSDTPQIPSLTEQELDKLKQLGFKKQECEAAVALLYTQRVRYLNIMLSNIASMLLMVAIAEAATLLWYIYWLFFK